jgi:hypothetical protein
MAKRRPVQREDLREGCSECDWVFETTSPHLSAATAVQLEFETHDCSAFPRAKRKTREDFSHAAARIVREATEKD